MKGTKQVKKFGGRPLEREPQLGKRAHLSAAVPLPLKQGVEKEAEKQGRSISNEVVKRLEHTFYQQSLLPDVLTLAYGRQLAGLVMALGLIMDKAGRTASSVRTINGGENWIIDPYAFDQAVKAVLDLLEAARPPGDSAPEQYSHIDAEAAAAFRQYNDEKPRTFVIELINAIKLKPTRGAFADEAPEIRSLLGPIAERLAPPPLTQEAADYEKLIEKLVAEEAKKARRRHYAR